MKVTLVRPATVVSKREIRPIAVPPLGLAYLAGSLEAGGHHVSVVDGVGAALTRVSLVPGASWLLRYGLSDAEIAERIPADAELVAVSSMFSTEWPLIRPLIQEIRRRHPNARIIAGGEHVTACPEYVLKDCPELDWCGLGEGEELMVNLAGTLAKGGDWRDVKGLVFRHNGEIARSPVPERIREIDAIPPPAWNLFPIREYIAQHAQAGIDLGRSIPMLCSRGCPYECTFCSNPQMYGNAWKARDIHQVLAEMRRYIEAYDVTNFDIFDLTMVVRRDWILAMSKLIIESGLKITWQLPSGTRSEVLDGEVSKYLYESGCRHIIYAPESGSNRMLKLIKKKVNKSRMVESVRAAVKQGIVNKANFIVGFPDERLRDVLQSYAFSARLAVAGMHEVSYFAYSPYPGAELYARLEREGKVRLSDEHFLGLLVNTRSFSAHIPEWALAPLRWTGVAIFFSTSFVLRPWRMLALLRDLWQGSPHTRLGSALLRIINRWRSLSG